MIDDIVTRLREALKHEDGYQMTMAPELVSAIADEIERLREAGDWLRGAMSRHYLIAGCPECDYAIQVWKAVRGD